MILANNLYDSNSSIEDPVMKEIIYYNEIDWGWRK